MEFCGFYGHDAAVYKAASDCMEDHKSFDKSDFKSTVTFWDFYFKVITSATHKCSDVGDALMDFFGDKPTDAQIEQLFILEKGEYKNDVKAADLYDLVIDELWVEYQNRMN